jgi:hypothetical protein
MQHEDAPKGNAVPGYYTVAELAAAAGKTPNTIRHHCRTGRLAEVATATGREWLIPDAAGNAFIIWALGDRS